MLNCSALQRKTKTAFVGQHFHIFRICAWLCCRCFPKAPSCVHICYIYIRISASLPPFPFCSNRSKTPTYISISAIIYLPRACTKTNPQQIHPTEVAITATRIVIQRSPLLTHRKNVDNQRQPRGTLPFGLLERNLAGKDNKLSFPCFCLASILPIATFPIPQCAC